MTYGYDSIIQAVKRISKEHKRELIYSQLLIVLDRTKYSSFWNEVKKDVDFLYESELHSEENYNQLTKLNTKLFQKHMAAHNAKDDSEEFKDCLDSLFTLFKMLRGDKLIRYFKETKH